MTSHLVSDDELEREVRPVPTASASVCSVISSHATARPDHPAVVDEAGRVTYAEHHRTLGDRVADLVAAGFVLQRLVEPEWPAGAEHVWGGWSPLRGRLLPGTVILVARRGDRAG